MTDYTVRNAMDPDVVLGTLSTDEDGTITAFDSGDGTGLSKKVQEGRFAFAVASGMNIGALAGRFRNYTFTPVETEVRKGDEVEIASGDILKTDPAKRLVFGWAYITHDKDGALNIDKSGDFADDIEEIEKSAYAYVLSSRKGDADHTNVATSDLVESIVFTPEKIEKMGLPAGSIPLGWWLGFKVHDDDTWARVERGELRAFSIHGKGTRSKVEE